MAIRVILLALALALSGCTLPSGTRKITAWGLFVPTPAGPIVIGYWQSVHGEHVAEEESAKPGLP